MSKKGRIAGIKSRIARSPDSFRIAALSAWRGKARGAAVIAGVFLASLVISSVLVYGSGLMQLFFQNSLESEYYDFRMDFYTEKGGENRTDDYSIYESYCIEMLTVDGVAGCSVAAGRQGEHGAGWFSDDYLKARPLEVISWEGNGKDWSNVSFTIDEDEQGGPPISAYRPVRMMGEGMFTGVLADRHSERLIQGSWPSSYDTAVSDRLISIPNKVFSEANAELGDKINVTFQHDTALVDGECSGRSGIDRGFEFCYSNITLSNLTISSVFDDTIWASPVNSQQSLYIPWGILSGEDKSALIAGDHSYLAIAIDRTSFPTDVGDTVTYLEDIEQSLESIPLENEVRLNVKNIVDDTISFLEIQNYLVQVFVYIIMIPIVILSMSVLIYGLILSLEQRRREISIHRTIGGSAKGLHRMVILELAIMSFVAWLLGYLLAMFLIPYVLNFKGFLHASGTPVNVSVSLGLIATLFTAFATLGLALIFGRSRTKSFLEQEIAEGVRKVQNVKKPRYWLHWTLFVIGALALFDTLMERSTYLNSTMFDEGLIANRLLDGIFSFFGPFFLWVGGALVLSRLGASAPSFIEKPLRNTNLLRDVGRAIQKSSSTEGVGRLSLIIVLTLSIVTMAATQGYTGSKVDERTVSLAVGSDIRIIFDSELNETEANSFIRSQLDDAGYTDSTFSITTIPILYLHPSENDDNLIETWIILDGARDVLRWDTDSFNVGGSGENAPCEISDSVLCPSFQGDMDAALDSIENKNGFTLGKYHSVWQLTNSDWNDGPQNQKLATHDCKCLTFNLSSFSQVELNFAGEHQWMPGMSTSSSLNSMMIGEDSFRTLTSDVVVDEWRSATWWVNVGDLSTQNSGDDLVDLSRQISYSSSVSDIINWEDEHRDVERNGGLIFGAPGLLSLQFLVASSAAVVTSFVFLSLVLTQKKRELALIQAIGGSHAQVTKLILFEILSIVVASMLLGGLLGMGITYSFNGLFDLFGQVFQAFGGSETPIERTLVWPWFNLFLVGLAVFSAVLVALLATTRRALKADLAGVLKTE